MDGKAPKGLGCTFGERGRTGGSVVESALLLDAVMGTIDQPVVMVDADRRIVRANRAFEVKVGVAADLVVGRQVHLSLSGGDEGGEEPTASGILSIELADDDVLRLDVASGRAQLSAGRLWHILAVIERSTPAAAGEVTDELTGLPGRALFFDRTEQAVKAAGRAGKLVSVLMVGIDQLTMINDAFGEKGGDAVLRAVAERLQGIIRGSDTVARIEGDRFALIMPIAHANDSVLVAEKIMRNVSAAVDVDGQHTTVTSSIGISVFPDDARNKDELVAHAERAMRYAKDQGRNRYQFFANEMNERAKKRLALEKRMRTALLENQFLAYYQPKIDVEAETLVGAEALIRWKDPDRSANGGIVSPAEFIPVAEETGLIVDIGDWILRRTCDEVKAWFDLGLPRFVVSVNVSARQFAGRDLIAKIERLLDETGFPPDYLELEITESMIMGNVTEAIQKMKDLRELGLSLSLDDFGTGYSSLSYLARFPLTTLKIDRAFIADVETNPTTAEIAKAIIGLSKGLDLKIVAEGAEVKEHIDFLRANGCRVAQGFYYSRPMAPAEFETMLRNPTWTTTV